LFRYTAWANARVLAALRAQPLALAEAMPLVAHALAAEKVWLGRLRGLPPGTDVWPKLTLEESGALADENAAGYAAYLAGLTDADLARPLRYRNLAGQEFETAIGEILTHVATHGGYHRGQVAKAFGRAGAQPVNTDYITFVRELAAAGR
jgi:uncharacterized damage-inducible protein DinB